MDPEREIPEGMREGENLMLEYTDESLGDLNVAIFNETVRGLDENRLRHMIENSINNGGGTPLNKDDFLRTVVDLVILCFNLRNCRGGKGEKSIFYTFFIELYERYPQTMLSTLRLIPHYGCYKDFFKILEKLPAGEVTLPAGEVTVRETNIDVTASEEFERKLNLLYVLRDSIYEYIVNKIKEDEELRKRHAYGEISLLAKYMPRKNGQRKRKNLKREAEEQQAMQNNEIVNIPTIYDNLKRLLYPDDHNASEQYRKLISKLSGVLDVTERKMCTQKYSDINFENVPSCCLNKFTKAFLNETRNATELNDEEEITGNRYPNLKDRVDARKELQRILGGKLAKKINGKQLHPHEIVKKFLGRATSRMEGQLYQVQWNSIREGVEQSIRPLNETELPTDEINLGKLVPLVDVSGSMGGTPMEVAIAMGILISEVNHPAFQNRFLTFTDQPEWVTLHPTMSIQEKVHRARNAPWGYSTNFILAMELILKEVVDKHMRQEDIPDLIVFSDMQFDEATRTPVNVRETRTERKPMHEIIKDKFNAENFNPPKIIYWNLRATGGHVVKAKEPNVMMLSGFSPAMLRLILEAKKVERETDEEEKKTETVIDENGNETVQPVAITPYKTMQLALRDPSYDEVRRCLEQSEEEPFKDYPAPAIRIHSLP